MKIWPKSSFFFDKNRNRHLRKKGFPAGSSEHDSVWAEDLESCGETDNRLSDVNFELCRHIEIPRNDADSERQKTVSR